MGCSKNLVDSERLKRRFEVRGYDVHHDSHDVCGEIVVVNTCGFIGDAKQESINMILELLEAKQRGVIGKLYVMGCLSQRYLSELKAEIEGVDGWYGKFDWEEILSGLPAAHVQLCPWERSLTTPPYSAYLKISEGCNRMCAYCAIPLITGHHRSRPMQEILDEVRELAASGVKEFNVIAQDLSAYGTDLPGRTSQLAMLIDSMSQVPGVEWIRLHYAYPVNFPWDLLEVIRRRPNVCNYLDIALQHISTNVLTAMRRHIDKEQTLDLIERIRKEVPGIRLRTTLMTGFPGEGEKEFDELLDFVRSAHFDRLGAFAYSEEEGTWAANNLDDSIPQDVKEYRRDKVLELQEEISQSLNNRLIGSTLRVLVEEVNDDEMLARTEWDSPEVDYQVHIDLPGDGLPLPAPGDFVDVTITDALPYDVYAQLSGRQ